MPRLYHSVPLDEAQSLNGAGEKTEWMAEAGEQTSFSRTLERARRHWTWFAHALLLSISMTLFTLSVCMKTAKPCTPEQVTAQYSTYSPIAPGVRYETVKFNLTPIVMNDFVGYGRKVDLAWDTIANSAGDIMITEEERVKLGISPKVRRIQDPRTGKWGYRAGVEVFHQLHCLNLVRQAVYKDYYLGQTKHLNDVTEAASTEDLHGHVDHCIEALRLNLMCQGEIGVFGFRAFPELAEFGIDDDWPDFETNHVCRNFDDILKFNNDRVVAWDHDV